MYKKGLLTLKIDLLFLEGMLILECLSILTQLATTMWKIFIDALTKMNFNYVAKSYECLEKL